MRRILYRLRPACLLCILAASLALSTCDTRQPEIDIELETDFRAIIEAIRDANRSLDDKLALIEAALNNGLADNQAAMNMVQEAVASLGGTKEEKLAAIEAAVQARTTGLAAKIGLIETAIQGGFADDAAAQGLLGDVVASLGKTMEEQLAGIEAAIGDGTLSLSAKMALVEAAVQGSFADNKKAQDMIQAALDALGDSLDDKLAAVETAMQSQTTGLETKLSLIEAAASAATGEKKLKLIQQAVASLRGNVDDKLAAIGSALGSHVTTLDTKLGLVSGALDAGLLNAKTALGSIQTAIQSSSTGLGTLDSDIQAKIATATTTLGQLTTAVTTDNLGAALASILSSPQPDFSTTLDALLKAIQDMGKTMGMAPFSLTYMGNPNYTMTAGGEICVLISVNPVDTLIDASRLKVNRTVLKQFFPVDATMTAEPDTFFIHSVVPVATKPGQYEVTVAGSATDAIWTESELSIAAAYGNAQEPKYVVTEPFQVEMMPRLLSCFNWWYYPGATIMLNASGNPAATPKDVMKSIYLALDKRTFETQDLSESREYPIDDIESIIFRPVNDSIAPVEISFDKAMRIIRFTPDTAALNYHGYWPEKDPEDAGGRRLWKAFLDSSGVKHETVLGKLILTDCREVKDTIKNFQIAWYNSSWFPENAIVSKGQIQDDNTAEIDIRTLLSKLGLERSWLKGRYIVGEQYGELYGYIPMSAQLLPESLKLGVKFLEGEPAIGNRYGLTARIDVWTFPSETNPTFKIQQVAFNFNLVVTIVN